MEIDCEEILYYMNHILNHNLGDYFDINSVVTYYVISKNIDIIVYLYFNNESCYTKSLHVNSLEFINTPFPKNIIYHWCCKLTEEVKTEVLSCNRKDCVGLFE